MNNLNLDNPVFVFYLDVRNLSRHQAQESIAQTKDIFSYNNVETMIVPIQDISRVECLWRGKHENVRTKDLFEYIISLINDGDNALEIRQKIRDYSLNLLVQ